MCTRLFAGEVRLPYISEENHDEDPEMQASDQMRRSLRGRGGLQAAVGHTGRLEEAGDARD